MRTNRTAIIICALPAAFAGCSGDGSGAGGAGGAGIARPQASPAAQAVVTRARALRVKGTPAVRGVSEAVSALPPAVAGEVAREGTWLVAQVRDRDPGASKHRADVKLASAGAAFRVMHHDTRLAVDVRPAGAAPGDAEVVDGYVVYRGAAHDAIHRVTAEGTEDFVAFAHAPARAELAYDVALGEKVAGLRLVADTLELLDGQGTPRLRMAPPYVVDAAGEKHAAHVAVGGCAVDEDPRAPWGRAVTAPGAARCTVRVTWGDVAYPAIVDPAWTTTGSMATARWYHTASALGSGKVLVAGGGGGGVSSAELYDPATGTWSATASMANARRFHTASVLGSGKALVAGGDSLGNYTTSAELYDPATGTWSAAGSMTTARGDHTASVLGSGKVLVAGGRDSLPWATAELYDPGTNTWSATGSMATARTDHTASVLGSGKVLVAGGANGTSAELYDPATSLWSAAGGLAAPRSLHTASVLTNGKVLIAGGRDSTTNSMASAELYDPATNLWSATGGMATARMNHTASVLGSGKVLVAGGRGLGTELSTELYDSAAGTWSAVGSMTTGRYSHTASVLGSGKVLVAGGANTTGATASAELFAQQSSGTCTVPGECASGFCVDGFCCNTACSAPCDVCAASMGASANGTCSPASATQGGNPSCGAFLCNGTNVACPSTCASDAGCTANSYCASNGTCQPRKATSAACNTTTDCQVAGCRECSSGNCADGFCCDTACGGGCDVCAASLGASADGTCTVVTQHSAGSPSCSPFLCDGTNGACPTTCAHDTDCASGYYCDDTGQCVAQKTNGQTCNLAADCKVAGGCQECSSGHCTDGVCCDQACNAGACNVCQKAHGSPADGTCGTAKVGYTGTPPCGSNFACDGTSLTCPASCAKDTDCLGGYYCASDHACKPQKAQGATCSLAALGLDCYAANCRVCTTGFCVDGVCCDTSCNDNCDVCDGSGTNKAVGTCEFALAGSPGSPACGATVCSGTSHSCPGSCTKDADCASGYCAANGQCAARKAQGDTCDPTAGKDCLVAGCAVCGTPGGCVDGVCCNTACNGGPCNTCAGASKGTCTVTGGVVPSCPGYLCDGASPACPTTCNQDSDCASGFYCAANGTCQPQKSAADACDDTALADCKVNGCRVCATGHCSDHVCCDQACTSPCDVCAKKLGASADGTCTPVPAGDPGTPTCSPYVCGPNTACLTGCTKDAECASGYYCASTGKCEQKKAQGDACDPVAGADCKEDGCTVCASENCVGGRCCDTACNGACSACTKALGAPQDGTCSTASPGYPGAPSCGNYVCDGAGMSCPTGCTSDSQCASSAYCRTSDHTCQPKADNSETCEHDSECSSGHCVDGICCNTACNGSCKGGTCQPVNNVNNTVTQQNSGCAVSPNGGSSRWAAGLSLLGLLGALARLRRRAS